MTDKSHGPIDNSDEGRETRRQAYAWVAQLIGRYAGELTPSSKLANEVARIETAYRLAASIGFTTRSDE